MSKIKPGDVIKHEKFTDVCFCVSEVSQENDGFSIVGCWMNMGYTRSWMIDSGQIFIKYEDISKWAACIDASSKPCIRYCTWVSLAS
jgi:hypothetical protein